MGSPLWCLFRVEPFICGRSTRVRVLSGSGLSAPHTFDTWNIFTFATELQAGF
jgi:hypothetical protein